MSYWRPAFVFGVISVTIGITLMIWGLTREYRDLQRIYALVLGFAGIASSAVPAVIAAKRKSKGTTGRTG